MLTHKDIKALSDVELVRKFECAILEFGLTPSNYEERQGLRIAVDWLRNELDGRLAVGPKPRGANPATYGLRCIGQGYDCGLFGCEHCRLRRTFDEG